MSSTIPVPISTLDSPCTLGSDDADEMDKKLSRLKRQTHGRLANPRHTLTILFISSNHATTPPKQARPKFRQAALPTPVSGS
ncbi:hypothetical protein E4U13_007674 [Claviceps humidiphila]|uniref:Uncharacterized protein n=1 Tax=Claviceps humidiphila TaxID=1294629 RepID=A0A9P7PUP8_9HYPO|nr:hypothetical protein E4U13_007674 [Claviceps humidiphila]